jgi:phage-related tail fiber protein
MRARFFEAAFLVSLGLSCAHDPGPSDPDVSEDQGGHASQDQGRSPAVAPTLPAGVMMAFAGATPPDGWWLCDGRAVSPDQYPDLFRAIGGSWGDGGDGAGPLFNIPDLRGRFVRGADNGAGVDPEATARIALTQGGNTGDRVGSAQQGATAIPRKKFNTSTAWPGRQINYQTGLGYFDLPNAGNMDLDMTGGDLETRPANVAVNWIIKY